MAEAASHKLQETVAEIVGIKRLVRWVLAVSIACVLLVALAGYLYFQLHDSQVSNCENGNQTRGQQEQLWDTLFALSAEDETSKPSAQTQKLLNEFLGDVKETYAPVDCAARYPFW